MAKNLRSDQLTAVWVPDEAHEATLVAEIGSFDRFDTPRQLMGYLGLVPSEHSSGSPVRRGPSPKLATAWRVRP